MKSSWKQILAVPKIDSINPHTRKASSPKRYPLPSSTCTVFHVNLDRFVSIKFWLCRWMNLIFWLLVSSVLLLPFIVIHRDGHPHSSWPCIILQKLPLSCCCLYLYNLYVELTKLLSFAQWGWMNRRMTLFSWVCWPFSLSIYPFTTYNNVVTACLLPLFRRCGWYFRWVSPIHSKSH